MTSEFLNRVKVAKQQFDQDAAQRADMELQEAQQRDRDEQQRRLFRPEIIRLLRQRAAEILPTLRQSAKPDRIFPDVPGEEKAAGPAWYLGKVILGSFALPEYDEVRTFGGTITDVRGLVLDSRGQFFSYEKRFEDDDVVKKVAMGAFISTPDYYWVHPATIATDDTLLAVAHGSMQEPSLEAYLPSPIESQIVKSWEGRLINLLNPAHDRDEGEPTFRSIYRMSEPPKTPPPGFKYVRIP